MDVFVWNRSGKVAQMREFDFMSCSEQNQHSDPLSEDLAADNDLIMEQILENLSATPIGQVLKNIASLPEIRKQKVLHVRRQLTEGKYDLNERLEIALDKVLEDLTA
jgi:hypothetical protein